MVFYCSPKLGYCSDIRLTKESYDYTVYNQPDSQKYLTSRPKTDKDLDSSEATLADFNMSVGRNECDLEEGTVVLDFFYKKEANTLEENL